MHKKYSDGGVYIMRGLPGVGKSFYIQQQFNDGVWKEEETIICSADDYMVNDKGVYEFKPWKLTHCHTMCRLKFIKAVMFSEGIEEYSEDLGRTVHRPKWRNIVVDNTNIELEHMAEYILLTRASQYTPVIVEIPGIDLKTGKHFTDRELAIRAAGHGVDVEKIATMRRKYQRYNSKYMDHLVENDFFDPFSSYLGEQVNLYRVNPDDKSKGISERIKALMVSPSRCDLAKQEFDRIAKSKKKEYETIKENIAPYKDISEMMNLYKSLTKNAEEGRLEEGDDIMLKRLQVLHDYFFLKSNHGKTDDLTHELSSLENLEPVV